MVSKLPGLGPKSAKRIVLKLVNNREELIKPFVQVLTQVYKNVVQCKTCGNIRSSESDCSCTSKNFEQICVVENIADMWAIQSSGIYKGHYHILGGTLASTESKKNDELLIQSLVKRVSKNSVKEIILATSATVEGQMTAHYIQGILKDTKVRISKLAQGLPVGGEIEFLDDGTLLSAFKNRATVIKE